MTSALDGDEWLASRHSHFTSGERASGTHRTGGWVPESVWRVLCSQNRYFRSRLLKISFWFDGFELFRRKFLSSLGRLVFTLSRPQHCVLQFFFKVIYFSSLTLQVSTMWSLSGVKIPGRGNCCLLFHKPHGCASIRIHVYAQFL
jgi:hypothetical protein